MSPETETAPLAEWRGSAIRYPFEDGRAVGPVDLRLRPGERVLLLGPSGSGKSTLLLALTGLVPQSVPAEVAGETRIGGRPTAERTPAEWADTVAQYFQDADRVLCGMRVRDEIAFAPENQALPVPEIERRIADAIAALQLPADWLGRRSLSMSGGERQLVALAAILAQGSPVLLADEPTAHLAPEAAARLHRLVAERRPDRAVLVVDHRLDGLIEHIDRVVVLGRGGTILAEGPPRRVFREDHARLRAAGIWRPVASDLDALLRDRGIRLRAPPLGLDDLLEDLGASGAPVATRAAVRAFLADRLPPPDRPPPGEVVAALRQAASAPFGGPVVLRDVDLALRAGEVLALVGPNGAGKSTLGAALAGLLRLRAGRRTGPPGAMAMQRPEDHFAAATVRDEIAAMLPKRLAAAEAARRIARALAAHGLDGLETRHPFALSEGQKRRLVLAAIEAADRWPFVVLDEPSAGLDAEGAATLVAHVEAMRTKGRGVVLVTHDMDLALRLADRAVLLGGGGIVAAGPAAELLLDARLLQANGLAAPAAAACLRWLGEAPAC